MKKLGGFALLILVAIVGSGISRANNTLEMMAAYEVLENAPEYPDYEDTLEDYYDDESGYMEDSGITVISGTHPSNASYDGSDIVTNTTVEDDDIVHGKSYNSSYDYYDDDEDYEYDCSNYYDYLDNIEYDLDDYYYIDTDEYYDDGLDYEEYEYYFEDDDDDDYYDDSDYDLFDEWEYEDDDEYWDEDEEWYDEDDEYYSDDYDWYEDDDDWY